MMGIIRYKSSTPQGDVTYVEVRDGEPTEPTLVTVVSEHEEVLGVLEFKNTVTAHRWARNMMDAQEQLYVEYARNTHLGASTQFCVRRDGNSFDDQERGWVLLKHLGHDEHGDYADLEVRTIVCERGGGRSEQGPVRIVRHYPEDTYTPCRVVSGSEADHYPKGSFTLEEQDDQSTGEKEEGTGAGEESAKAPDKGSLCTCACEGQGCGQAQRSS